MCDKKEGCRQPEKSKGDPKQCSPEQIEECHGDAKEHPCVSDSRDSKQKR